MACCLTHQAITWTNVDWSSRKSSDIQLRTISQAISRPSITKNCLKITCLKFYSKFPGANELKHGMEKSFVQAGCAELSPVINHHGFVINRLYHTLHKRMAGLISKCILKRMQWISFSYFVMMNRRAYQYKHNRYANLRCKWILAHFILGLKYFMRTRPVSWLLGPLLLIGFNRPSMHK